jgi:hypothetical protein
MQHFYDGQIRRYLGQVIRMLSGFKYKAADGTETTVPVVYGDMTRQVGAIIRDNSENKIASAPRIAVYITGLSMDRGRLSDATFVSKVHIRQREKTFDSDGNVTGYTQQQGDNYTVERLMPTPYKLSIKADIWSTNTDQKLQIMEQILMLFNPSLEIQTTDNFIDWTSLSVVEITDITFSSRSIPVGAESEIDIGSLTFETPIWISPPTKVKKLGVVTDIVMNIFDDNGGSSFDGAPSTQEFINIGNYGVLAYNNTLTLLKYTNAVSSDDTADEVFSRTGPDVSWQTIFDQYPGKFRNDISQIFLLQENGNKVVGRLMQNPTDPDDTTKLYVNWDRDTFPTDTLINSTYYPVNDEPNGPPNGRVNAIIDPTRFNPRPKLVDGTLGWPSRGRRYLILENIGDFETHIKEYSFITEAKISIIDTNIPFTIKKTVKDPLDLSKNKIIDVNQIYEVLIYIDEEINGEIISSSIPSTNYSVTNLAGILRINFIPNFFIDSGITVRYSVEFISDFDSDTDPTTWTPQRQVRPAAWKNQNGTDFYANANDIIEWNGNAWEIVLSKAERDAVTLPIYVTNENTGIQYKFIDDVWVKSFEGEYSKGQWRLVF